MQNNASKLNFVSTRERFGYDNAVDMINVYSMPVKVNFASIRFLVGNRIAKNAWIKTDHEC